MCGHSWRNLCRWHGCWYVRYSSNLLYLILTVCLATIVTDLILRNGNGTVIQWLQSTLLMDLNGVLMPVLILNVRVCFLGLYVHFCLCFLQGPMVSKWKYGNAFLVYRNKPGHLSPQLVLSNWRLRISAWILRTGSRPTKMSCRFGPAVEEIRTKSGLRLQPNGSVTQRLSLLLPYSFFIVSYDELEWTLDTDELYELSSRTSPSRFLVYTIVTPHNRHHFWVSMTSFWHATLASVFLCLGFDMVS